MITSKFVFDVKYDEMGELPMIFKTRLIAIDFSQIYGINYEETFAPIMAFDAFRILISIACAKGWKIRQLDVVTAFLAGILDETVFIKAPFELRKIFGDYI